MAEEINKTFTEESKIYLTVGSLIRNFRNQKGLTQEELAQKINMSRPTVVNIETGKQNIPIHILYNIAQALGTDPKDLLPSNVDDSDLKAITFKAKSIE